LELIKEVEKINDDLDRLYFSKYFYSDLIGNSVRMPPLYTTEKDLDLLCELGRNSSGKRIFRRTA
jgi:hypothetical protein